jgi:hypothetical protein
MMTKNQVVIRFIIWFIIAMFLALVFFSIRTIFVSTPWFNLGIYSIVTSLIVTSICASIGYGSLALLKAKPSLPKLTVVVITGMCSGILAGTIIYTLNNYLCSKYFVECKVQFRILTVVFSVFLNVLALFFERMIAEKNNLELDLVKKKNPQEHMMSIREDDLNHIIHYDDLVYLSSHGKKTVLHTRERGYETSQSMKNIEIRLSDDFIRIHRRFIINKKYLVQIKYHEGGRYIAYLKDDYDALPVSRLSIPSLRESIGM